MEKETLINFIKDKIHQNNAQKITGQVLQDVLIEVVDELGGG